VILVAPYLAYARKDQRTKSRDPITTRYIAQICEAAGVDEIIVVDVHNHAAFENAFRCRKQNVSAAPLFAGHFQALASKAERVVVLSPDSGGVRRARHFADLLAASSERSVDIGFVEKHRSEGHVSGGLFAGDVQDALVVIIDDMISSGTTIRRAAALCRERGAVSVHAAATHGVFAEGAAEALGDPTISSVTVTDSVSRVRERAQAFTDKLVVLECAPLLSGALRLA
jgi:ribose-phosphate pyrophosphokinase